MVMMTSTTTTTATNKVRTPASAPFLEAKESNKLFSEKERFEIYHKIECYACVRRFLEKKARNNKSTPMSYHTGLTYFEKFLNTKSSTIQDLINKNKNKNKTKKRNDSSDDYDIYDIISDFVQFMMKLKKSSATINISLKAFKGLLRSEMITLDSRLVHEAASVPRSYRDESNEYALDKPLVSKILQSAKIRRLRVFLFCLASSGCRVGELASIKWSDLNLNTRPASIHLRPETTKTRTGHIVYISDEAKEELNQWRVFKEDSYAEINKEINDNELVFLTQRRDFAESESETHAEFITHRIQMSFVELLESLNIGTKKQQQDKSSRHTITTHSFRKFFKTQVSLEAKEPDLAEYLIGHRSLSQTYFRVSPKQIQQIYLEKLMPLLTFCDAAALENKILTLTEKTEIITDLQRQLNEQKEKLLSYEQGQEHVNELVDAYAQERLIKSQDQKIKELEEREQRMMAQFDEFRKEVMERLKK
jgi:integrase